MPSSPHSPGVLVRPFLSAALVLSLAGCTAAGATASTPPGDTHGYVEGAVELSEARLSLIAGGADGLLTQFDLVTGERRALAEATAGDILGVTGDGRYIFRVVSAGAQSEVEILDSGVWTVEHGDHFHYYAAGPRAIGSVTGSGTPAIRTADRRTAVTFPGDGEVIVLAHDDLDDGSLGEPERVEITSHPGVEVIPYADTLLTTAPGADGTAARIDAIGSASDAAMTCAGASAPTLTRVGVVFPCATGAVLVTGADGDVTFEEIPYPEQVAPPATALDGRTGRPSVAGVAGSSGAWRLDTRAREWTFLPTAAPVLSVSAVSDDADLTVAVDVTGRVLVMDAAGATVAVSEAVLAESVADPATASQIRLIVDAQRAYVSDPAGNRILEIDYRDGARIARTFDVPAADFLEQVG